MIVDQRHGYTVEHAPDADAHREEYAAEVEKLVSRQTVDTLEEMLEAVADLCIERFGGEPGPAYAAAGWPGAQEIVALHDQRGGSLKLPNGESISVERVEDGGVA